ncbi:MAG TPA: hypothetical protein VF278_16505 [Pirellulales bacterium]
MLYVVLPLLAFGAAIADNDPGRPRDDERGGVSPAVRRRLERADAALAATGRLPTPSLPSRNLGERMRRLSEAPAREEVVTRTFDYALLARIAAKNRTLRDKQREQGRVSRTVEKYRKPPPKYLSTSGEVRSPGNASQKPSRREAIAQARQKLRKISLQRQLTLPRPST